MSRKTTFGRIVDVASPAWGGSRTGVGTYGRPADEAGARRFLTERMARGQSVILLALEDDQAIGFVQLYPSFSSIRAAATFVLNDLYVEPGRRLVAIAAAMAREAGAAGLSLVTGVDNLPARTL